MFRLITLRSLRARPVRMLLSMFGIVLGVAGILAIGMTNQTALDSVARVFNNASGKANLVVVASDSTKTGFGETVLRRVNEAPGVALAVPSLQIQTVLGDDAPPTEIGLTFFGASAGGLLLYGIDPVLDMQARTYKLVAGRFLGDDAGAADIVLVETYAHEKQIEVGQRIRLRAPEGAVSLRVVGLMAKDGPGLLNNGAFGVLPLLAAQKLFDRMDELNQVDIIADPQQTGSTGLDALRENLQATLGDTYSVIYPAAQGKRMVQMLGSYQIGLNFLSGIALFVGVFLIYNAFSMTVVERTRELGMLRTIGMTRGQVTQQVLAEALILGILGSILGLGLGVVLARGLSVLMETMLAQDLSTMRVPPNLVVVSAATGVGATLVAALMPAWQAGRTSPLEALRSRARTSEGWLVQKGWILGLPLLAISAVLLILNPFPYDVQFRLGSMVVFSLFCGATLMIPVSVEAWEQLTRPLVQLFYGGSGRLGSRNIQRAKLRTTLTVAALMIGVAMIIIVRGMTASFKNDLQAWLDAYVGGDLYVGSSLPMRSRVWKRLESVPGVAVVAPIRYLDVTWEKPDGNEEKLSYMAIDPLMHGQVTSFVFSQDGVQPEQALQRLNAGRAVFVSSVLAEKNKLARGDSIRLRTRAGPRDFEIAAVVVDFYNQGLVVNGSWEDMRRYFRVADANAFLLRVQPGYQPDAVRQVIDDLYGERDDLIVESNRTIKERVFRLMDQAFSMFDVLALIAVFVAALGVINTLTQNVMERTQEIGMLRAVGMTRRQIVSMVLAEAGVLGVMAGITGLLFGVTLARIFLIAMTAMSGYRLTYVMPAQGVAVALIIAIVVSQLAALLPARRAASIRIMEAVHYE